MANTPRLDSVSTKRQRIAELARDAPEMVFTSLAHHIDMHVLRVAYAATRKDGAVGLDGQTAADYAVHLEANLQSLLDRFKSGQYVAPPVRRVHIPKGDGRKTRPIGIPTFEDKVLQRAVVMVLESVYEQDFRDCSFGFRPGRSAHQALQHLWERTMVMGGGWVIDLDIQGFFDVLDHSHLRGFLDRRVRDGVLRRAIDKWLKAGVLEDGRVSRSVLGTPQGGVVSPLLANIYLHHVLDVWFTTEVQPRLRGRSVLVRYADDVVIVLEQESDAHRVWDVLPKRLGRFGLTMHPVKSRPQDAGVWAIPAARMKAKRDHRVPLSSRALAILHDVQKRSDGTGLVFRSLRGKPLSAVTLPRLTKELGIAAVPHGFRSSFRDWAAERTNAPREVVEAALAHTVQNPTEAAYARSDLFERRRRLMDDWAVYLNGARGHVVA